VLCVAARGVRGEEEAGWVGLGWAGSSILGFRQVVVGEEFVIDDGGMGVGIVDYV
jgi:hypothetical protein